MKKTMIISASLLAIFTLSGPSVASLGAPCVKASAGEAELICFCQPGGTNCRCTMVSKDAGGVETW